MKNIPVTPENYVYQTQVTLTGSQSQLCQMGALWENPEAKTNTEIYQFHAANTCSLNRTPQLNGILC